MSPADERALPTMYPGQFVQILVDNSPQVFLRRPISINFVDYDNNELWLLIQRVGEGTRKICEARPGDTMNLIYPLGNSFTLPDKKGRFLLVGGGVGTAPLLFLGKELHDRQQEVHFLLGGRSEKDILQRDHFEQYGSLHCTTEDGTLGEKGFVTQHAVLKDQNFDFIFTCGPKPMMVAVAQYSLEKSTPCEASLENLMACGFGACLCCIEKTTRGNVCACTEEPFLTPTHSHG